MLQVQSSRRIEIRVQMLFKTKEQKFIEGRNRPSPPYFKMPFSILALVTLTLIFFISGNNCPATSKGGRNGEALVESESVSFRQGGVIVESLGEVAMIEDYVTLEVNISDLQKLPKCLTELKKALFTVNNQTLRKSGSTESWKRIPDWRMERGEQLIDSMLAFLLSYSMHKINNEKKELLYDEDFQEKTLNIYHSELSSRVNDVCSTSQLIQELPASNGNLQIHNVLTTVSECLRDTNQFLERFIHGLQAANEGDVLISFLPTEIFRNAMSQVLLKWHLKPIVSLEDQLGFYYNLLECHLMEDLVIINIPFKRKQFYALSRLVPFPVAVEGSLLMMNVKHNLILTSDDLLYSYPSDMQHCKKPFPLSDFYVCPLSSFNFYVDTKSSTCERDVFFKRSSVSSCTYSHMETFSQPFSVLIGSNHYLYFHSTETVFVTCISKNPGFIEVRGSYALHQSCEFKQLQPPFMILLPNKLYTRAMDLSQTMTNISDLVEIPSNWDISNLNVTNSAEGNWSYLQLTVYIIVPILVCILLCCCCNMQRR